MTRGSAFLNSLNDNRNVWMNGERIEVGSHPAFRGTLATIRELFDMADHPDTREQLAHYDSSTDSYVHHAFLVPHNKEDLDKRSAAARIWSESTFGVMSRLSDYARSRLTGWYATRQSYTSFDKQFDGKIAAYYTEAKARDLFLTAVQREPQTDRSKALGEDPDAILRIIRKTSEGVIIRGAKMIATAGPYANDFIVYPVQKIPQSHPECANMLIVPASSAGLHILCRESFAENHPNEDHPLGSRFDEMDAILFFDDVLVPWERVLLYDNPEALWKIRTNQASNSLAYHQSIVRLQTKLEFVAGITFFIAREIGVDGYINVQEKLGELVSQIESIKALIIASEVEARLDEFGNLIPKFSYIETARNLGTRYYPRAIEILKTIGAGGFIQVPSSCADLESPIAHLIRKYLNGTTVNADQRVRLFKLAWDLIGSQLGARHELYERFYAGDPTRNFANQYVNFDKTGLYAKVSAFLDRTDKLRAQPSL
ncbi:4-hydroxyphenylacetate 3-hydroxylase family protein [Paenibacillus sepulcri]